MVGVRLAMKDAAPLAHAADMAPLRRAGGRARAVTAASAPTMLLYEPARPANLL
jgi:hypothetical protein